MFDLSSWLLCLIDIYYQWINVYLTCMVYISNIVLLISTITENFLLMSYFTLFFKVLTLLSLSTLYHIPISAYDYHTSNYFLLSLLFVLFHQCMYALYIPINDLFLIHVINYSTINVLLVPTTNTYYYHLILILVTNTYSLYTIYIHFTCCYHSTICTSLLLPPFTLYLIHSLYVYHSQSLDLNPLKSSIKNVSVTNKRTLVQDVYC